MSIEEPDWKRRYEEEHAIVDRIWRALGIKNYDDAGGKEISQLVAGLVAKNAELVEEIKDAAWDAWRWRRAAHDLLKAAAPASGIVTEGGDAPAAPGAERLEPARTHASSVVTQGGSNDRG